MTSSRNLREIHADVVEAIYGAGMDPDMWPQAIERLRVALNWTNAVLATPEVNPKRGGFIFSRQVGPSDLEEYQQVAPRCVWTDAWVRAGRPRNSLVTHDMIAASPAFARTEVFQEYFRPRDMLRLAGVVLYDGADGRTPKIGLHLSIGAKASVRRDGWAVLERLIPHMRRALEVNRAMMAEQGWQRVAASLLELTASAIIVVDKVQRVVHATPRAEAILALNDGIGTQAGRLVVSARDAAGNLERSVAHGTGAGLEAGSTVLVPRPSLRGVYRVTTVPVPRERNAALGMDEPAAIVVVHGGEVGSEASSTATARTYGLTPTECRVLDLLVQGQVPKAIADRLGIRIATVRLHLRNLFAKTGARRQADLVRLVLSNRAPIASLP